MKKVKTIEAVNETIEKALKIIKKNGVDSAVDDDFAVVQPLADGEGIIIKKMRSASKLMGISFIMPNTDEKGRKVSVTILGPNSVFIMPKKEVKLDVFTESNSDGDESTTPD